MDTGSVVGWFGLPAGTTPSRLVRALRRAGYLAVLPVISRYECVFLDTQDGRLGRRDCRLSIRQGGRGATWHISDPEGESDWPFEGDVSPRCLSSDAAGVPFAAAELAGGRLFLPLVRLRVFAWETRLQSPSGSVLALRTERFTAAPPRGPGRKGRGLTASSPSVCWTGARRRSFTWPRICATAWACPQVRATCAARGSSPWASRSPAPPSRPTSRSAPRTRRRWRPARWWVSKP